MSSLKTVSIAMLAWFLIALVSYFVLLAQGMRDKERVEEDQWEK